MNNYSEIKIPSYLVEGNVEMSLDLDEYLNWFLSIKHGRLQLFYGLVFNTEKIDFSIDKLKAIYYFLKDNISTKPLSEVEIKQKKENLPLHVRNLNTNVDKEFKFVEPTFSLVFDLSIYIGELLLSEVPNLSWDIERDFDLVNYGVPKIIKNTQTKNEGFSPYWNLMTLTGQIYRNEADEDILIKYYNKWKDNLLGKKIDYLAMVDKWSKGKK
ncbi:MAG: hypothetical protein F9K23_08410 [Bacteroidetes bacterium]|nr:MAG: hypothetical protein F9K23_08410 [Bacteroidota bacterium]